MSDLPYGRITREAIQHILNQCPLNEMRRFDKISFPKAAYYGGNTLVINGSDSIKRI